MTNQETLQSHLIQYYTIYFFNVCRFFYAVNIFCPVKASSEVKAREYIKEDGDFEFVCYDSSDREYHMFHYKETIRANEARLEHFKIGIEPASVDAIFAPAPSHVRVKLQFMLAADHYQVLKELSSESLSNHK